VISHGALAVGGVVALAFGGLLLFDTDSAAFEVSVPLVLLTAAVLGGFFAWIIAKAVKARHAQVHTGTEELIGAHGEVRSPLAPLGHVFVKGALWRARSEQEGIQVGDEVVVEKVDGLTLTVAPADPRSAGPSEGVQSVT
jgi:membrane-bound serine protease (ClpP class)